MKPSCRTPSYIFSSLAFILIGGVVFAAPASAGARAPGEKPDLAAETKAWHDRRIARLTAEEGWLTLVGLHWLKVGPNTVGSEKGSDVLMPAGTPPKLGVLTLTKGGLVALKLEPGVIVMRGDSPFIGGTVRTDAAGEPDVLRIGNVRFMLLRRGERTAVRVKDSQAPARLKFTDIPMFPANAAWRVEARFVPAPEPHRLQVPNVLGEMEIMTYPGSLLFTVNGKEYRLEPVIEEGDNQLFIIFADETNHTETYHSGRFLSAAMPKDGKVLLDFNRAYNPPCSFTPYATCPLPPPQNKLAVRVEAGEKRYVPPTK